MIRLAVLSLAGMLVLAVSQTGEAQIFKRGGCPTCRVAIVEVAPVVESGCASESAGCSGEAQEGPVRRLVAAAPLRTLVKRGIDRRQDRRAGRQERRSSRRG